MNVSSCRWQRTDESLSRGRVDSKLFSNEEQVVTEALCRSESERCSSSWNESEFEKPSLFFLLSDTASSTLYFLVPPLQIHTEEDGCNQGRRLDLETFGA
ncbi:hypothetical protein NQZ68_025480 [Dissostichus eleginoides]|nr:hypothetical protein NQZ68_025480 [Dissostichus eleginoides]